MSFGLYCHYYYYYYSSYPGAKKLEMNQQNCIQHHPAAGVTLVMHR